MRRLWWMWKTSWWTEPTQDGEVVDRFVAMCAQTFGEKGFGELRWGLEMSRAWISKLHFCYLVFILPRCCGQEALATFQAMSTRYQPARKYRWKICKYVRKARTGIAQLVLVANLECEYRSVVTASMSKELFNSKYFFLCAAAYGSVEWERLVNESKHLLVKYAPATLISCILQQYYHLSNCFHNICGWSGIKSPPQCGIILFEGQ